MEGLQKRRRSILKVFPKWDEVLFPNTTSGLGHVGDSARISERVGLQSMLDQLNADEEELEEGASEEQE